MKLRKISWFALAAMVVLSAPSIGQASLLTVQTVSEQGGSYNNSLSLLTNGVIPAQGTVWTNSTNVYWNGTGPTFEFDLGQAFNVSNFLVSADNNDSYQISYSNDGTNFTVLRTIQVADGTVSNGMDIFSSDSTSAYYVPHLAFSTVQARYFEVSATGGDNSYALGEVQFFGSPITSTTPEPGSMTLLGIGAVGLMGYAWRRRKPAVKAVA